MLQYRICTLPSWELGRRAGSGGAGKSSQNPGESSANPARPLPACEDRQVCQGKEAGAVVYDIEFKENGCKCESDIREDGTYINFEKAIGAKDLPAAVRVAVLKRYPKATMKEIMEETEVHGKSENLSAYEVVLVTPGKKHTEVRFSPAGKVLEVAAEPTKAKK